MELFLSRVHPKDKSTATRLINEGLVNQTDSTFIFRFIRKKNEVRYASVGWYFESDTNKNPVRLFGIIQDITEIKKAEEKLNDLEKKIAEQKIQEQKKIARAIIRGQEKERNYIGQELHDNINQLLATVKMYLGSGMKKNNELNELMSYPMQVLEMSMEEIRLLCHTLVTPEKNINLKTLIGDLADKLEFASSLTTNISIETEPKKIPADLKLNIYRILQEQVNNIYKYAEAKNVSISIKIVKNEILVEIEDDGKGFDVKRKRKGVGITNMLNRVETFNGKMEIKSEPGKGCHIAISIPM
jgi:signal transduction histidine kinase